MKLSAVEEAGKIANKSSMIFREANHERIKEELADKVLIPSLERRERVAKAMFPLMAAWWRYETRPTEPLSWRELCGAMADAAIAALDAEADARVEAMRERVRDFAVEMVDGIRGFTMEFAGSPAEHRQMYDYVEQRLADFIALSTKGSPT